MSDALIHCVATGGRFAVFSHALGSLSDVTSSGMLPARLAAVQINMAVRAMALSVSASATLVTGLAPGGPYIPAARDDFNLKNLILVNDSPLEVAARLVPLLLSASSEAHGRVVGRHGSLLPF